ncbi:MAG: cation:proton antiporter [Chloroflexi bacterium]|nr:cation:proton antiporter [Chloroflexota bacterium]
MILFAAKLGGELSERYLKVPAVIGELSVGIIIGPFALGGLEIFGLGSLFEPVAAGVEGFAIPVSESLWSIAQVGSIILLFMAGLETDLRQFLRYSGPASMVALGGVILPFVLGAGITVALGFADSFTDPKALFIGAISTATSIGITVRVLGDLRRLDTPEGVTTLAAAVLDDVIGIIILTIVIGIGAKGEFSLSSAGLVTLKTLGFWLGLTAVGVLLSKRISRIIDQFRVSGAAVGLALGLAFLAAALAESFGLAMIIGAFSIGLALSGTDLAHRLEAPLQGVYAAFVPIFFVVMGMMVDVSALGGVWIFGVLLTLMATIGKVVGSGVPALFTGFNRHGALRIGVGMLPRGEVALIMAGIGVSEGLIGTDLFGVSIIMTMATTVVAPLILARVYKEGVSGVRSERSASADSSASGE